MKTFAFQWDGSERMGVAVVQGEDVEAAWKELEWALGKPCSYDYVEEVSLDKGPVIHNCMMLNVKMQHLKKV